MKNSHIVYPSSLNINILHNTMIRIRKHYDLIKTLTWISQVVPLLFFFLIQDSMQDHFALSRHEPLVSLNQKQFFVIVFHDPKTFKQYQLLVF